MRIVLGTLRFICWLVDLIEVLTGSGTSSAKWARGKRSGKRE